MIKSEADKARVLRMAAEYAAKNEKPKREDTRPMPVPASVDEHGVTAEMRVILTRREEGLPF